MNEMRLSRIAMWACLMVVIGLLWGCADSSTKGAIKDIDSEVTINIPNNNGTVLISPELGVKADAGDTSQDTRNTSETSPSTPISLAQTGSTASAAAEGALSLLDKVANTPNKSVDNSSRAATPETANPAEQQKPVMPEATAVPVALETVPLAWRAEHNRAFAWLAQSGPDYPAPLLFVFNEGCGDLLVDNPATDLIGGDEPRYFCGLNNKKEESNGVRASVFGPVGCRATEVQIYRLQE